MTSIKSIWTAASQKDKKRTADGMKLVLLRKIGDSIVHEAGSVLDGKLARIGHLVKVDSAE